MNRQRFGSVSEVFQAITNAKGNEMTTYTITTDAASLTCDAINADAAANRFDKRFSTMAELVDYVESKADDGATLVVTEDGVEIERVG